jgi:hypothetical protein
MTATCPVNPAHRAFRQSGGDGIACLDCQAVSKAAMAKPRANKYGAVKVETALGTADSTKEGRRLEELRMLQAAGEITDLIAHPSFDLIAWSPAGPRIIGRYTADAAYRENGRAIVEDVKSEATRKRQDYSLRRRIFCANQPEIDHRET